MPHSNIFLRLLLILLRHLVSSRSLLVIVIENDKIISIDNDEASHSITTIIVQLTEMCIYMDRRLLLIRGDEKYACTVYSQ